jgi:hypothetical protein
MKYSNETERRLLSVCWLREREMRDLLVKNVVWKEKRLYVVFKERQIEPFPDIPQGRDSLKGYEHVIWMVGESWLPVIAGQEQVLLELIERRDPDEHVFPEVHLPPARILDVLERQYAAALYTMFSGRTPPVDNTRIRLDGDYEEINPQRYDEDAVRDVAHVLGRSWMAPGLFAIRYIGRHLPGQKGKEQSVGNVDQNQSRS